jgi:hypothetical protein
MRHALMYQGSFEKNYASLAPGARSFVGGDDKEHEIPAWPANVDGLRVGYMEKAGKRFVAVRVQQGDHDVVLRHDVVIDSARHLGFGPRLSAEPTVIQDETALVLLDDIMSANPEQRAELQAIRDALPGRKHRPFA